ncbi:efflux transporter outer membrane subunit [Piscinibacter sp.]|uniref:efflux transporter outer membrane subunit n=1 Tax=Piscinibacter sp. TaxID=1903157 RepID=UPI002D034722|nr:efflux transporter outer membrane subunit [Albitalea sp.]HUG23505.1 efflux transporter outer membrane subunit [Albitalea sp.]
MPTCRSTVMRNGIFATLAAALLGACAAGPDYAPPDTAAPANFTRADGAIYSNAEMEAEFWRSLNDPLLARLVDDTLRANHDLRIALARYDRARSLLRESSLDRFPTVTAGATASEQRASAAQLPGATRAERDVDSYDGAISAAWELDFFGRVRRNVEAGRAEASASAADVAVAQVAVVAELAQTYFQLRGLQQQLHVARSNADNQRGSLELVQARLDAGSGTQLDVAQAESQLENTLALIPALESEVGVATHRIAVLTGRPPAALVAELEEAAPLPALPVLLPAGTPGELLRRRPDVIAAERRLAAATARIGVATADLFPRFTLAGLLGTQAFDTDALFRRDSETRALALGVDWTFLDIGRVRARIAAADADAAGNLASYEQTVLEALEEAENALVRYARLQRERRHLEAAAAAGSEAARLARLRFDGGVADFLQVLDAERTQLETEDRLVQTETRSAVALVALYRAMAGGWPM